MELLKISRGAGEEGAHSVLFKASLQGTVNVLPEERPRHGSQDWRLRWRRCHCRHCLHATRLSPQTSHTDSLQQYKHARPIPEQGWLWACDGLCWHCRRDRTVPAREHSLEWSEPDSTSQSVPRRSRDIAILIHSDFDFLCLTTNTPTSIALTPSHPVWRANNGQTAGGGALSLSHCMYATLEHTCSMQLGVGLLGLPTPVVTRLHWFVSNVPVKMPVAASYTRPLKSTKLDPPSVRQRPSPSTGAATHCSSVDTADPSPAPKPGPSPPPPAPLPAPPRGPPAGGCVVPSVWARAWESKAGEASVEVPASVDSAVET